MVPSYLRGRSRGTDICGAGQGHGAQTAEGELEVSGFLVKIWDTDGFRQALHCLYAIILGGLKYKIISANWGKAKKARAAKNSQPETMQILHKSTSN